MSLLSNPRRTAALRAGRPIARGKRFVLIASEFNRAISDALIRGAVGELLRAGASSDRIRVFWVPGAFELPVAAAKALESRPKPHAVIALGCLLRGETVQYEVLGHAVAQGLTQVAVGARVPVSFGVVMADTEAQAKARAGLSRQRRDGRPAINRGAEAALAALAVLRLFEQFS